MLHEDFSDGFELRVQELGCGSQSCARASRAEVHVSGMRLPRVMHVRTMSRIGGFCSSPRFLVRDAAIRLRFELVYHIRRDRDCETKA